MGKLKISVERSRRRAIAVRKTSFKIESVTLEESDAYLLETLKSGFGIILF